MSVTHWFILIVLGAAFGASFGLNEILLSAYGPLTVSAVRVALGALGCWAFVLASGRRIDLRGAGILGLGTFGVFQYAAPFALLPLAQEHVTSSVAGIANAMTPVAVVALSHAWPGGERATPSRALGIALGVAGMVVLVTRGAGTGSSEPAFVLVAALAPVCYGIALNLARQFRGTDPVVLTAAAMTGGAMVILPLALAVEGIPALPTAGLAGVFAILGFGLTSAGFLTMYMILPKVGATNVSLVTFVAPISATLIGWSTLGEMIGPGHLAGMAMILSALVVIDGRMWRAIRPLLSGASARRA